MACGSFQGSIQTGIRTGVSRSSLSFGKIKHSLKVVFFFLCLFVLTTNVFPGIFKLIFLVP